MKPKLIQPRAWSWEVDQSSAGRPIRYSRSQPAWYSVQDGARRLVTGWKAYATIKANTEEVSGLSFRFDIGGPSEEEATDARPLVVFDWPFVGIGSFFPITCFAAVRPGHSFETDGLHHMAYSAQPGLCAALPIWCHDSVRLLVTGPSISPEIEWSARVNLTLWIASD